MIRLLQLTDGHLPASPEERIVGVQTVRSFEEVLEAVRKHPFWPPAALLLTGDLVHRPDAAAYRWLRERLAPLGLPCMALPGNHDRPDLLWREIPRIEVLELGRWRVLGLSSWREGSYGGLLSDEELALLRRALIEGGNRPVLIALHHPPLPVESPWMDAMGLANRERFWEIIERFGGSVRAVVFGHIHQEFHHHERGIDLWSAPSTCFQFRPYSDRLVIDRKPPGWRWLVLHEEGVVTSAVGRLPRLPEGLDLRYGERKRSSGSGQIREGRPPGPASWAQVQGGPSGRPPA